MFQFVLHNTARDLKRINQDRTDFFLFPDYFNSSPKTKENYGFSRTLLYHITQKIYYPSIKEKFNTECRLSGTKKPTEFKLSFNLNFAQLLKYFYLIINSKIIIEIIRIINIFIIVFLRKKAYLMFY